MEETRVYEADKEEMWIENMVGILGTADEYEKIHNRGCGYLEMVNIFKEVRRKALRRVLEEVPGEARFELGNIIMINDKTLDIRQTEQLAKLYELLEENKMRFILRVSQIIGNNY